MVNNKENLENNLNRVHEWIKSADNKVSILLVLEGIIITLLISDLVSAQIGDFQYDLPSIIILSMALVLLFTSGYKSITAIIPRLKRHSKKTSLIYFRDVAKMSLETYKRRFEGLSQKDYEDQLFEQIHISSKIADAKYIDFRDSIITLILSLFLFMVVYIIQLLNYGY